MITAYPERRQKQMRLCINLASHIVEQLDKRPGPRSVVVAQLIEYALASGFMAPLGTAPAEEERAEAVRRGKAPAPAAHPVSHDDNLDQPALTAKDLPEGVTIEEHEMKDGRWNICVLGEDIEQWDSYEEALEQACTNNDDLIEIREEIRAEREAEANRPEQLQIPTATEKDLRLCYSCQRVGVNKSSKSHSFDGVPFKICKKCELELAQATPTIEPFGG